MNALKDYNIDVLNKAGETIPGFAVMQVSGYEINRAGREYIKVKKPDGDGTIFLLNSPFPIADDKPGRATDSSFCYALYNDEATPAVDEAWGPEASSWKLKKDNAGFFIVGDHKGTGTNARVRVALSPGGGSASAGFGKVTQEITAADLTATPPYLGWGLINPASFLTPVSGIDTEPATEPDDLEIGFDGDTDMVIYSTAGEVIPVDTVIQWKTLEPDGKRFVDVVHCESA